MKGLTNSNLTTNNFYDNASNMSKTLRSEKSSKNYSKSMYSTQNLSSSRCGRLK